jgi:hypothetical protein
MKKVLLPALFLTLISLSSFAQKGTNKIGIGGEIAFPTGPFGESFKTGFGGWVKTHFGVGTAGSSVTFSTGYTSFSVKGSGSQGSASLGIIPLLIGYHHSISQGLYIEPQAGYGSYHVRVNINGQSASDSRGTFTYAIGMGYEINDIDFGVRYQGGSIEGDNYSNVALRIGYNFALKNKSK